MPYDHLISIGFLNERPDGRKHGDAFDAVVCGNTGSVYPVADLVEDIVSAKSGVSAAFRRALSGWREGLLNRPGSASRESICQPLCSSEPANSARLRLGARRLGARVGAC